MQRWPSYSFPRSKPVNWRLTCSACGTVTFCSSQTGDRSAHVDHQDSCPMVVAFDEGRFMEWMLQQPSINIVTIENLSDGGSA